MNSNRQYVIDDFIDEEVQAQMLKIERRGFTGSKQELYLEAVKELVQAKRSQEVVYE